jgi:hypothetical protein
MSPLYHISAEADGNMILYRKRDGKAIPFRRLGKPEVHKAPYHERLSCQACHSQWIPQCYGCHEMVFRQTGQRDWLTGKRSPGRWQEGRSYLRFRKPTLGVWPDNRIGPFAPGCQVFIHVFDENGDYLPQDYSRHLVMAGFDPHTTALDSPACERCHLDTKVIGLGEGALQVGRREPVFEPVYDVVGSGLDVEHALDTFVSPRGKPLQRASRKDSRPFNGEELTRILRVGLCTSCHDQYDDPVYRDYDTAFKRFMAGETVCYPGAMN